MESPVFIVARAGSTRLPRKMMLDIAGKTAIEHHIERVRSSSAAAQIVLCTTDLPDDEEIVAIAHKEGVDVFRGDPENVPRRLLSAADASKISRFVMLEGDEMFADPEHIARIGSILRNSGEDYVRLAGVPIGSWAAGLTTRALRAVCNAQGERPIDGWSRLLTEANGLRVIDVRDAKLPAFDPGLRLTLDYPEDLVLVRYVYEQLYRPGSPVRLTEVLGLAERQPEMFAINAKVVRAYWQNLNLMHETPDNLN